MKIVKTKAYAKVNLTLEIVGQENGYHMLDSLVASVDLFDVIVLKKRKDRFSSITMKGMGSEGIPPEKNTALQAAEAFSKKYGVDGVDITVYKNIPMGAGLGGSSADVGGVLNGMAKLYGVDDPKGMEEIADNLGSDTKYMMTGGYARMQGRGTQLCFFASDVKLHFLAICPQTSVSTGACYREYDACARKGEKIATQNCVKALLQESINDVGRYLTNDLFAPAARLNADVEEAMTEALSFSPLGAVMTGSGSCVLAMFETKELCEWAKSRYKGKARMFVLQTLTEKDRKRKKLRNPFVLEEDEGK